MSRISSIAWLSFGALALAGGAVTGCRSGGDGDTTVSSTPPDTGTPNPPPGSMPTPGTGALRVVNGISDSGSLSATLVGAQASARDVKVNTASASYPVPGNTYSVQIQPDRGSGYRLDGVVASAGTLSTVVGNGVLANGTQRGFVARESLAPPPAGQVVVQPVFGAYAAAAGDQTINFSFGFANLDDPRKSVGGTARLGESPEALTLPAGAYGISISSPPRCGPGLACPTVQTPVFNSGSGNRINLPTAATAGANIVQVVAVDASEAQQKQYGSSVVVLLVDSAGGVTPVYNAGN